MSFLIICPSSVVGSLTFGGVSSVLSENDIRENSEKIIANNMVRRELRKDLRDIYFLLNGMHKINLKLNLCAKTLMTVTKKVYLA